MTSPIVLSSALADAAGHEFRAASEVLELADREAGPIVRDRVDAARRVGAWITFNAPNSKVRGSWRRGDFHLDLSRRRTSSDVDLFTTEVKALGLSDSPYSMKVSQRSDDYEATLTLSAAQIMTAVNLIQSANLTGSDRTYAEAKGFLNLLRSKPRESYVEIASSVADSSTTELALRVKLGLATPDLTGRRFAFLLDRLPDALAAGVYNLMRGDPERLVLFVRNSLLADDVGLPRAHIDILLAKVAESGF